MQKITMFVRRLRRAWRAEFGPPQRVWAKIDMPYPDEDWAMGRSSKTLSFWTPIVWTAGSAHFEPYVDGFQIENRSFEHAYVETQGRFGNRALKVEGGYMEPNRGFETVTDI